MGRMYQLDNKGHTLVEWDVKDEESVAKAAISFDEIVGKGGALAFKTVVKNGVKESEVIRKFDPTAEKIVLAPQMKGG